MTAPVLTSLLPTVARHLPPDRHATGVLTTPTGAHLPVVCEHIEREHDGVAFVSRVPYYVAYAEGEPTQHESPAAFQALVPCEGGLVVPRDAAAARTRARACRGRPRRGGP